MDKNSYLILPTSEHLTKEKFMSYLDAILNHMVALGTVNETLGSAFDIRNAAGAQLDIIGELVGVKRLLNFVPLLGTREMDDEEYRIVILLKIFRNEWDGTAGDAVRIYKSDFKDMVRIEFYDDGECNVQTNIFIEDGTRLAEILNSTGTLLIPAGVSKTVNVINNEASVEYGMAAIVIGCETRTYATIIEE